MEYFKDDARRIAAGRQEFADLIEAYPYMFKRTESPKDFFCYSPSIGDGWKPIFRRACAEIDAALTPDLKSRFRLTQVKEKLGGLRIYWILTRGERAAVAERVMPAIKRAESASDRTCEICGSTPATLWNDAGRLQTVCTVHAKGKPATRRVP